MLQTTKDRVLHPGSLGAVRMVSKAPLGAAAGDWWDPNGDGLSIWAAYQPKGAASLAASYTDLSGNGNNAGVGTAPTWDATNGWIFNGSTQYLTTTFVPATDQSQTMIMQFSNVTNTGRLGSRNSTAGSNTYWWIRPDNGGFQVAYANGQQVGQGPQLTAGNLAIAGNQGYRNGSADGGAIGAWGVAVPPFATYIGATNSSGAAAYYLAIYIQAFALYDTALTAGQVSAVATAMAAL